MFRFIRSIWKKKTPLVLQYEVAECGAASLSMVLRYYGLFLPLSQLRYECGVSRDGSNLLNIKNAAQRFCLKASGVRANPEELLAQDNIFPCICWWDFNHFLVVEGVRKNKVLIVDPAKGRYGVTPLDFARHFSGIALLLTPDTGFAPAGKPEREFRKFLVHLLDYKLTLAILLALALFSAPLSLFSAGLSGAFLSEVIQSQRFSYAIPIIWLTFLIAGLQIVDSLLNTNIYRRLTVDFSKKLTLDIGQKLFTVNFDFYSTRFLGDIASRLSLGSQISSDLFHTFAPKLASFSSSMLMAPFIFLISWQLSLVTIVYLLITTALTVYTTLSTVDALRSIDLEMGKLDGIIVRILKDIRLIKACNLDNLYISEVLDLRSPVLVKTQAMGFRLNNLGFFNSLLSSIYEYSSIALAALLVILGDLNLAGFMAFQSLRGFLSAPISELTTMFEEIQRADASLGRLTDLFSVSDDPKIHSLDRLASQNRFLKQSIRLPSNQMQLPVPDELALSIHNLSYQFSPLQQPVLSDISLELKPASMTTIVGPSGSGKSTLLKIIAGLSGSYLGDLLFSGHPWSSYDDAAIRGALGYVSQETAAMRASIFENIRLFDPDVSELDIQEAAEIALFSDVVAELTRGYATVLKESGMALSGGQMQRLAITRALCRKPKLLILDEATSALDVPTELAILNNIRSLGVTVLCVAHRLISAEMSDHVIVLQSGHVVEQGTPQQLKQTTGSIYSRLLADESSSQRGNS
ncbi:ATP-binding cassette domain-containing protein [Synechococcus sp. HK05]|uniref:peptidase domain-containing ABC transporter n=1 Tax=Synechococcus sp. HK05 TaxID=2725975 RepID=UPI001C38D320|nr:cysteine peptidase family C39 domain-containing protein [Synechococcus sp. HK05]MBV2351367.1 ATP-binding cassette domain-containing protein [Synechococcus sp. HK05]